MKLSQEFINKYAPLVSELVCRTNNVDFSNMTKRALLGYSLLNGTDYVKVVPKEKDIYFTVDNGCFLNPETKNVIATTAQLVEDPVKVAFDIALDCEDCAHDGKVYDMSRIFIQLNNLTWVAALFEAMHNYYSSNPDEVPLIWKLCDWSYTDYNHLTSNTPCDRNTTELFVFAKGCITTRIGRSDFEHGMRSGSCFLESKLLSENPGVYNSAQILEAYMKDNNLFYFIED